MFSVIIPTRNRPVLFKMALDSVLAQTCDAFEIIVVDDGSNEEHCAAYRAIVDAASRPIRFYSLVRRPRGHGQSYALNFGADQAQSEFLCFLDDDDAWTDQNYLERVRKSILTSGVPTDLYLSNQTAFLHGRQMAGPLWVEALADHLRRSRRRPNSAGVYSVSIGDLLQSSGFCHLNTLIVRHNLYEEVGGMDEGIRWECDHDLYLRLIDKAQSVLYSPLFVSRHNIPDPSKTSSMTTSLSEVERRLFQLRVFNKAVSFAVHPAIRAYGKRHGGYTLKRIAEAFVAVNDYSAALYYARVALGAKPTMGWAAYTAVMALRALFQSR